MGIKLAEYPSSKGTHMYQIIRGKDGVVYCTCMSWKMSKDCKHLKSFLGTCSINTPGGQYKRSDNKIDKKTEIDLAVEQAVKELTGRE